MSEGLPIWPVIRDTPPAIVTMSEDALAAVTACEEFSLANLPQIEIGTQHVFHAGMYARTIMIPAGVTLTGALIKIATMIIGYGEGEFFDGQNLITIKGYAVLPAMPGRKQIIEAHADTYVTMLFPTEARTVEDAEKEFTDEWEKLFSRHNPNRVIITRA